LLFEVRGVKTVPDWSCSTMEGALLMALRTECKKLPFYHVRVFCKREVKLGDALFGDADYSGIIFFRADPDSLLVDRVDIEIFLDEPEILKCQRIVPQGFDLMNFLEYGLRNLKDKGFIKGYSRIGKNDVMNKSISELEEELKFELKEEDLPF
jgi:hypothetical protein